MVGGLIRTYYRTSSKSFAELSEHGTNAETITCVKIKVVCFDGNESALSSSPHLPPLVSRGLLDTSTQATGHQLKCYQAFAPAPVAVRPPQFFPHIVTSSDSDAAGFSFRTSQVSATPPALSLALCPLPARSALFARRPCVLHAARVFCTPPVCSARRPCVLHGTCALCMLPAVCALCMLPAVCMSPRPLLGASHCCVPIPADGSQISVTSPTWSPGVCPLHTDPGERTSLLPFLHVAPALCTAPSLPGLGDVAARPPSGRRTAVYLYDITVDTAIAQQICTDINDHFSVSDSSRRPPPPVRPPARARLNHVDIN
ncbi:hypothetical protein GGX14DRAFT_588023 [Mycena pura]|uniref:Uncharacterized protein n=1 Tax=Mycena pura TaxID=153505 RepID=A0AAD6Y2N3_9AGAR|nr:hypothetical protein GGX14DRAFT_588023 [Mycena pura]